MPVSRFTFFEQSDAAILTASSEAPTRPAVNLQDRYRTRVWRSTALAGQWVRLDFGAAVPLDTLALVSHNLSGGSQVTVQAGSSAGAGDLYRGAFAGADPIFGADDIGNDEMGADGYPLPGYETDWWPNGPVQVIYLPSAVEARYWQFSFDDPDNPDDYLEIGRLGLGFKIEYDRTFTEISECGVIHPGGVNYSLGGAAHLDPRQPYRQVSVEYQGVPQGAIWAVWQRLRQRMTVGRDFVTDLYADGDFYPAQHEGRLYGHLAEAPPGLSIATPIIANLTLTIRESV
ncbi:MAG: hypothetical protein KQJ78_18330 [Deltaproteobacteria bacterium]|nr:hypothetical protein [Deltaproteobacteria bacterium]